MMPDDEDEETRKAIIAMGSKTPSGLIARSDEIDHVQAISESPEPPLALATPPPVVTSLDLPDRSARVPDLLLLASGGAALVSALLFFWNPLRTEVDRFLRAPPAMPHITAPPALAESVRPTPMSAEREPIVPDEVDTESYQGFGILVDSTPEKSGVIVNGIEMGATLLAQDLDCSRGSPLEIVVSRPGYQTWTYKGRCLEDHVLKVTAKLVKK